MRAATASTSAATANRMRANRSSCMLIFGASRVARTAVTLSGSSEYNAKETPMMQPKITARLANSPLVAFIAVSYAKARFKFSMASSISALFL